MININRIVKIVLFSVTVGIWGACNVKDKNDDSASKWSNLSISVKEKNIYRNWRLDSLGCLGL